MNPAVLDKIIELEDKRGSVNKAPVNELDELHRLASNAFDDDVYSQRKLSAAVAMRSNGYTLAEIGTVLHHGGRVISKMLKIAEKKGVKPDWTKA